MVTVGTVRAAIVTVRPQLRLFSDQWQVSLPDDRFVMRRMPGNDGDSGRV
jgi:hypothetical protein